MTDEGKTISLSQVAKMNEQQLRSLVRRIVTEYNTCENEDDFGINVLDILEHEFEVIEETGGE